MSGFLWGILIVIAIWVFSSMNSKAKVERVYASSDEADSWFVENNISSNSVMFNSYEEHGLSRNPGATVLVGIGKDLEGESVGFGLEVIPGEGVVSSEKFVPYGIAMHDKEASMQSNMTGQPLLDVLVEKAENHRSQYS